MKKILLGSAALMTLCLGPAVAADMPVKAPMRAPAPIFSWAGCYVGVNGGYAKQTTSTSLTVTNGTPAYFNPFAIPGVQASGSGSLNSTGGVVGVEGGCQTQFNNFVLGVETDVDWMNQGSSFGGTFLYTTNNAPYLLTTSEHKDWMATGRARAGIAFDRVLLFGTAGIAVLGVHYNQAFSEVPFTTGTTLSNSGAAWVGFTVGAGVEGAITNNWTVKVEYLFSSFDPGTYLGTFTVIRAATLSDSLGTPTISEIRGGINYKF
jgi:outer membrane immunogenic protein